MKIAFFTGRALPTLGGAEIVVDRLARKYTEQGHQVTVIAPRRKWWMIHKDAELPYSVHRYMPHWSKSYFVESYVKVLKGVLEKEEFDILHCHEVWPHAYLAALLKNQGLQIPVVLTSHGSDAMPSHPRYSRKGVYRKACWAMGQMDAIIANSPSMNENILKMCSANVPVVNISNGVDEDLLFNDLDIEPQEVQQNILLFMGRLTQRKGVEVLLNALSLLSDDVYHSAVIAGWGKDKGKFESLATKLGLQDKVSFVGPVQGSQKRRLLQNASCVVIPTLDWEACSLVALESFASATPIIASDIEGISHFFKDGDFGQLVAPGNAGALALAIETIISDPESLKVMGRDARKYARQFAWSDIAKKHLGLYESILNEQEIRFSAIG